MNTLKAAFKKIRRGRQQGFTLAEVMIAMVISGLIIASLATLSLGLTRTSGRTVDQSVANMQVQYAGFWVSQDAVQAQKISCQSVISGVGGAVAEDYADPHSDWLDQTTAAQTGSPANGMTLLPAAPQLHDAYYIGNGSPFGAYFLELDVTGIGVGNWTITYKYWNGQFWSSLVSVNDETNGFKPSPPYSSDGWYIISWTVPDNWEETEIEGKPGVNLYWVKAEVTSVSLPITTQPKATRACLEWGAFPSPSSTLTMEWTTFPNGNSQNGIPNIVTYSVEPVPDEHQPAVTLWNLKRRYILNGEDKGTILVAEHLVPPGSNLYLPNTSPPELAETYIHWYGNVLELKATAKVDREYASRTYQIQPRPSP